MLVKVDISLAVSGEPPQRRRVWHFIQTDWQGVGECSHQTSRLVCHRYFLQHQLVLGIFPKKLALSCTDLSHLVFSCPTLPPAHGSMKLVVRQLSSNNFPLPHGKQTQLRVISVPSIKLGTSVYLPSGEPENNIFLSSSQNSQTSLPPTNLGGI